MKIVKMIYVILLSGFNTFAQSSTILPDRVSIPKMTTAIKNALLNKTEGMMVYDSNISQFSYWTGTTWVNFGNAAITATGWQQTGNDISSTNTGNIGIGTFGAPLTKLAINGDLSLTKHESATNGVGVYNNIDTNKSSWIYLNSSGQTITGFTGGVHGKILFITCPYQFTISTKNLNSDIQNRINGNSNLPQSILMSGCILIYNINSQVWQIVSNW